MRNGKVLLLISISTIKVNQPTNNNATTKAYIANASPKAVIIIAVVLVSGLSAVAAIPAAPALPTANQRL